MQPSPPLTLQSHAPTGRPKCRRHTRLGLRVHHDHASHCSLGSASCIPAIKRSSCIDRHGSAELARAVATAPRASMRARMHAYD